jgi:hypothetical protein
MDAGSLGSATTLGPLFLDKSTSSTANLEPVEHGGGRVARGCRRCHAAAAPTAATLRYRRAERTALYIQTQEGDVVRLRIEVRDGAVATLSGDDGTALAEISVDARSSTKISFHVDGDLNADELAAIRSVIEQASGLAQEFFAGDLPKAFAAAQGLDIDASQLAKVGLRLGVREQVTYSAARLPTGPAAVAPAPTAAPPSVPAALPAPAVEPAAPVAVATPTTTDAAPAPAPETAPLAQTAPPETPPPRDATEPTPAARPALPALDLATGALATIADFLDRLLEVFDAAPADSSAGSIDLSLKLKIFQSAVFHLSVSQPAAAADSTSALPLVTETLDALAAARAPLDARA